MCGETSLAFIEDDETKWEGLFQRGQLWTSIQARSGIPYNKYIQGVYLYLQQEASSWEFCCLESRFMIHEDDEKSKKNQFVSILNGKKIRFIPPINMKTYVVHHLPTVVFLHRIDWLSGCGEGKKWRVES